MFSDRFRTVSDRFGRFRTVFGRFRTVSDGFGSFSDGFGRFRIVFGPFRTVSGRVPAVSDESIPNFKNFKFQLATAAVPSAVPFRPPSRGQLKFEILGKNRKKTRRKRPKKNERKRKKRKVLHEKSIKAGAVKLASEKQPFRVRIKYFRGGIKYFSAV